MTARSMRPNTSARFLRAAVASSVVFLFAAPSWGGPQQYEHMSASVRAALHSAVSDRSAPATSITDAPELRHWRETMSPRLQRWIPDARYREELLVTIHYEATRAGLDPQLVLSLIQIESAFRKYAVSSAGARGYMQIMPFWVEVIGRPDDNLFHMRTNLRYGCIILRHYIDIEKGDLFRALGRYNGSLGRATYPELVRAAWNDQWHYAPLRLAAEDAGVEAN